MNSNFFWSSENGSCLSSHHNTACNAGWIHLTRNAKANELNLLIWQKDVFILEDVVPFFEFVNKKLGYLFDYKFIELSVDNEKGTIDQKFFDRHKPSLNGLIKKDPNFIHIVFHRKDYKQFGFETFAVMNIIRPLWYDLRCNKWHLIPRLILENSKRKIHPFNLYFLAVETIYRTPVGKGQLCKGHLTYCSNRIDKDSRIDGKQFKKLVENYQHHSINDFCDSLPVIKSKLKLNFDIEKYRVLAERATPCHMY